MLLLCFSEPDSQYEVELETYPVYGLFVQKFWTEKAPPDRTLSIPFHVVAETRGPYAIHVTWQCKLDVSVAASFRLQYTPVQRVLTSLVDKAPTKSILV